MARVVARTKSKSFSQKYLEEYFAERGEKFSDESSDDIREIGCREFRIWSRIAKVVRWQDKNKSAVVLVEGHEQIYNYPFHSNIYQPLINFEVTKDINYVDRFSNGELCDDKYVLLNERLVAMDGEYLGDERFSIQVPEKFSKIVKVFV